MSRIAVVVIASLALLCGACSGDPAPPGTSLSGEPAADFHLTNAAGAPTSLAEYRGRPVLLTFLYTQCPDVCPVIAQRTGQALQQLGADAAKVAVLVVSVDPANDTPAAASAFMAAHGLTGADRRYLLGDAATLAPVWLAYGVSSEAAIAAGQRASAATTAVEHTDALILIDREGRKQRLLRGDASVASIAAGLRYLLR